MCRRPARAGRPAAAAGRKTRTGPGGVARIADRPLGPAGGGRAVLAAPGTGRRRPRRARDADRAAGRGEVALLLPAADAAGGRGHAIAVPADVWVTVPGTDRDRRGLPASAARAVAARVAAAADFADRLPVAVLPGTRADLAAA